MLGKGQLSAEESERKKQKEKKLNGLTLVIYPTARFNYYERTKWSETARTERANSATHDTVSFRMIGVASELLYCGSRGSAIINADWCQLDE
jgi:hypothetical protein